LLCAFGVRALFLMLLLSCGSGDKGNRDGGSRDDGADAGPGEDAGCMLDGDCAPGDACLGALPGVAGSGRCAAAPDRGLAPECWTP